MCTHKRVFGQLEGGGDITWILFVFPPSNNERREGSTGAWFRQRPTMRNLLSWNASTSFLADDLGEDHHVTRRQAAGRNNRVTDTFSTPSQQELERTGSPVSFFVFLVFQAKRIIQHSFCYWLNFYFAAIQCKQKGLCRKQIPACFLQVRISQFRRR